MGKHQPALLGGLLIGVLSVLPVVSAGNLCCCLWVIVGGILTVYLQQQRTPMPVETADAVIGGLIAGLIGAVIVVVGQSLMVTMTGAIWQDQLREALDQAPEVPPEARDAIMRMLTGSGLFVALFAILLPLYAIFSMLGALIGLAIFRKKTPPAAPTAPDVIQG